MTERRADLACVLILVILPFLFFWPVTFGGQTLVPADNLTAWEPWQSLAPAYGITQPHNELLSDLILENYVWKLFICRSLNAGELPLWNPYLFSGVPFLAAGQHSAMYPFSVIFYILPLARAYGLFSALQLAIAAVGAYAFLRVLGARPFAALAGGVAYAFSAFMVVSVGFTMMIAAAAWLPWCLLAIEMAFRRLSALDGRLRDGAPWLVAGAIFLGLQILAGHVEITYYVLLVMAYYAAWRLVQVWLERRRAPWRQALLVAGMFILGLTLGAVQLLPLYELVQTNFRSGAAAYRVTYADVVGWAYPWRQIATFIVPDLFGNPSVHTYFDVTSLRSLPITHNALGEPMNAVAWGKGLSSWKNYVEAGSYVGILPLLALLPALLSRRFRRHALPFGVLAVFSVLLVFGTPLYRLIFLLPGINQLHSPFRWVFPYTFSLAVLTGLGLTALAEEMEGLHQRVGRMLGWAAAAVGGLGLAALLLVLVWPRPFVGLAGRVLASSELSQRAFADGGMFLSYQFRNFLILGAALIGGGLALVAVRLKWSLEGMPLWAVLPALVVGADLFVIGYGFYPRANPALLEAKPPVVEFLEQDSEPWRFTTFIASGEKPLNANAGMLYSFEDIRGYDSIIPRQYVEFMSLIEAQDELLYNRIAPLSEPESLDSPLLDLLNVKYVLSTRVIERESYQLVFDDGSLKVYENLDVMPRAFAVTAARRVPPEDLLATVAANDPREAVILEGEAQREGASESQLMPVSIVYRANDEVRLLASLPEPGWVVLSDAYSSGWRAYVSRAVGLVEGQGESSEQQVPVERAYGAFRAVYLPEGDWFIRFDYMPRSFQVGLYVSFIAAIALFLIALAWLWGRYYHQSQEEQTVRRVAKNSLTPMALSLLNKLIDMAFAMLMLRILAPEGAGRYQFAVAFIGYFEILVRFGLGTFVTREVAREKERGPGLLGNTLVLRGLLWLASLPLMAIVLAAYVILSDLTLDVVAAVALFAVAIFLGNVADAFSSIFYAHEKMEHPAFISTGTTLVKVTLGAAVLLLGGGFVGLAAVSIVSNLFTVVVLLWLLRRDFFSPRLAFDRVFAREMVSESFPLMVNHLLATVFFQVDILLLQPMRGDVEVGYYGAAYRYIRGLDIIPSYFTMALFPVMARYARSQRESLQRAYRLSLRLLLMVSLPIAMGTSFIARELILLLAGSDYLPQSQWALQILIWFMPFGFINSVTQYVLIALDEQHYLTRAFVIGVAFNVVANVIAIPLYGFLGAAAVTVLSELALLLPFMNRVYRHLDHLPWLDLAWRPLLATAVMGLSLQGMRILTVPLPLMVMVAAGVYAAALWLTGVAAMEDMDMVLGLFRRRLQSREA